MHTPDEKHAGSESLSSIPQLPRTPSPSKDPGIAPNEGLSEADKDAVPDLENIDVFTLRPVAALKLLCGTIEGLVRITGDVPPTPPISLPSTPNLGAIHTEKENVARHVKEVARRLSGTIDRAKNVDSVPPRAKTPIGSPEAHPTEPFHVVGANMESLSVQHGAIIRKFYSKKPPAIGLEEYLMRIHGYCPMSTAVYLATSLYIYRLAVGERIIPVTARNVHRLVLAGLRVAMKALEDLSYSHQRFAKVGGVSEPELAKLEVSFCFLTNFELRVDHEMLLHHAKTIREGPLIYGCLADIDLRLPWLQDKRTVVVGQAQPSAAMKAEAPAPA